MILTPNKGYALLEVLVALLIISSLLALSLRYQFQIVRKSAAQFQQLLEMNQQRNLAEKVRAQKGS